MSRPNPRDSKRMLALAEEMGYIKAEFGYLYTEVAHPKTEARVKVPATGRAKPYMTIAEWATTYKALRKGAGL